MAEAAYLPERERNIREACLSFHTTTEQATKEPAV